MKVGYTKLIKSGNLLEIYQYEQAPKVSSAPRRKRTPEAADSGGRSRSAQWRIGNAVRAKRRFVRLVRANINGSSKPAFITLTMHAITTLPEASICFTSFARLLSKTYGSSLRYIAVPEFQKRGAVHFHCLIWGIPESVIHEERDKRYIQNLWGYGYVDGILTDGSDKLAGYLAKYMQKSMSDERIGGKRGYYANSAVLRPVSFKTAIIADHTKLVWGVDKVLVHESSFMTDWLGAGRYYRYNLIEGDYASEKH